MGGGIDRVQQGYCITFKMKFETKKTISVKTQNLTGFPIFNRLREQKNKNPLFIEEEKAFSNCPVRP